MTDALEKRLKELPSRPGCYRFLAEDGRVLYVGKATHLRSRVRSYFSPDGPRGRSHWVERMMPLVADVEFMVTTSPLEALLLENTLIKQHRPPFNSRLTDDKHYPYICLTWTDEFPRLVVVRRVKQDGNQYFGPYTNSKAMHRTLNLVRRLFGICTSKPTARRPDGACLQYHIGYCSGACAGVISQEEYRANLRQAARFLRGQTDDVVRELRDGMQAASQEMQYEKAAELRDRLQAIEETIQRQVVVDTDLGEHDAIGIAMPPEGEDTATVAVQFIRAGRLTDQRHFTVRQASERALGELVGEFLTQYYDQASLVPKEVLVPAEPPDRELLEDWLQIKRGSKVSVHHPLRGDKKRLVEMAIENAELAAKQATEAAHAEAERGRARMESLMEALRLSALPRRIECYDISTLHGKESVGSMVVFEDGMPAPSQYRLFRIREDAGKADDYAMLHEVLQRRVLRSLSDDEFGGEPDLLVIDGGKGQLNAALAALGEIGTSYSVISLAKRNEEVFVPGRASPVILSDRSPALQLLMHIRDEAHRFAITFHRKRRGKAVTRSLLDEIPGVGPKRKQALLERFPTVGALCQATVDDLASVPGVSSNLAAEIHRRLKTPGTGSARREDRAPVPSGEWIDVGDESD